MGNRKQPFGYRMEMGEIVIHPQEANLVEHIFQQYISGATYNILVAALQNQPLPYDEGKAWNKNMIARILEDRRYTGESGFPAIIQQMMQEQALEKRSTKQVPSQKTETQKALRRLSGHTATKWMEQQVLNLFNSLARQPECIKPPLAIGHFQADERQLQRELDTVMEHQPIDEDAAQKLILAIAAAQYSALGSGEYETIRLRRIFCQLQPMTELDAELLQSTVSAIQVHSNGSLTIRLKNDQIIEGSEKP